MQRNVRLFLVFLLIFGIIGCGGMPPAFTDPHNKPTAADLTADKLLPLREGNTWLLYDAERNAYTRFTIAKKTSGFCESEIYDLFISKTVSSAYWSPGHTQNIHYYLTKLPDGSIRNPGFWGYDYVADQIGDSAIAASPNPGDPLPDLILEPTTIPDIQFRSRYQYVNHLRADPTKPDLGCFHASDPDVVIGGIGGQWTALPTLKFVNAPAYKGWAACYRYSEGGPEIENNAEEWCFAPGIGLVELTNLHFVYAGIVYGENGVPPMVLNVTEYHLEP